MKIENKRYNTQISFNAYFKPNKQFNKLWQNNKKDELFISTAKKFQTETPNHELEVLRSHLHKGNEKETLCDLTAENGTGYEYIIRNNKNGEKIAIYINSFEDYLTRILEVLNELAKRKNEFFAEDNEELFKALTSPFKKPGKLGF